jgi:hypothetical protein
MGFRVRGFLFPARRNNALLQRIVAQQKLKAAYYKHHNSLTHHLDEAEFLELSHVFISLAISDNGQPRLLGLTPQRRRR